MSDLNSELVEQWLLAEMVAYGLVLAKDGGHVFHGDRHDFEIEVRALPIRKIATRRLSEPVYEFGPDYDSNLGYN